MSPSLIVARLENVGKIMVFLVDSAARNRTPFDKVTCFIVGLVFTIPKNDEFMVDNDTGYDLEELTRYLSGK